MGWLLKHLGCREAPAAKSKVLQPALSALLARASVPKGGKRWETCADDGSAQREGIRPEDRPCPVCSKTYATRTRS